MAKNIAQSGNFPKRRRHLTVLLFAASLTLITVIVYWGVVNNAFLYFDDNVYITDNPSVTAGISLEGLRWAFTTNHTGNWHPLTWLSHMVDAQIFGLWAPGHHMMNVFIHAANSVLLLLILHKMTGNLWPALFTAALFAIHPLHVESVAWAAERKDVLSTMFMFLTIAAYTKYAESPSPVRYLVVFSLFVLGLLSKPMLVTVPFVLLLLDYWPLKRLRASSSPTSNSQRQAGRGGSSLRSLIVEKLPLLVPAIASSVVTFIVQRGAISSIENLPVNTRVSNAIVSYVGYLSKMIYPTDLVVLYPFPASLPVWQVVGAIILCSLFSYGAIRMRTAMPYLLVGWFWYLGTLIPVIGLVQVGAQAMADRYTYIPLIGIFIAISYGMTDLAARWKLRNQLLAPLALGVLIVLAVLTIRQVGHWRDTVVLFERAIYLTERNPRGQQLNFIAQESLARILYNLGRRDEAIRYYRASLEVRPNQYGANYGLGLALLSAGMVQEAVDHLSKACREDSSSVEAHYDLGTAYERLGKMGEAIGVYETTLRLKPDHVEAQNGLGALLGRQGRTEEAIAHLSRALQLDPIHIGAHNNMGIIFAMQGSSADAKQHFREVLRVSPSHFSARYNLGLILQGEGHYDEAIEHFSKALEIRPDAQEVNSALMRARESIAQEKRVHQ